MEVPASICFAVASWLHNHHDLKEDDNRHRLLVPFMVLWLLPVVNTVGPRTWLPVSPPLELRESRFYLSDHTWQKMGYQVAKGEKGIRIFSPRPYNRVVDNTGFYRDRGTADAA